MFALASCTKQEVDEPTTNGANPDGTFTFNLAVEEPDYAPQAKAAVTMGRYILEMYEGNLSATPLKMDNTTGTFDVSLKKGVDYVCLFWADNGIDYDAASLKAVKQVPETNLGTAAYFANVKVNSKTFNGAITLKRAVAELSFVGQSVLAEATNKLKITYPYASATLNVGDGTVTHTQGSTVRLIENIAPPAQLTDAFASDFVLAPVAAGSLVGLKLLLNTEMEKTIPQTAIQANYRTKITGDYQADPIPFMSFTIDTRKNSNNTSDATFILPLDATLSGYSLTVDWGDSNIEKFAAGTKLDEANMTHTYAAAGVYTVTISSSQKDAGRTQMPDICFYDYKDVNKNNLKLISLDTPLLNMGTTLWGCFYGCESLTSIPATLFERNTTTTRFMNCFEGCKGLTTIPATLFEKNTAATSFSKCFTSTGLTTIPAELFKTNTKVTAFNSCFSICYDLTTIPATLFENNTAATDFSYCFTYCTGLTSIPATLFEHNTAATDFMACFSNCTQAELNSDIFCTEASDKATRFAGKTMTFDNCFEGCGSRVVGGTAPTLWDYTMASSTHTSCFLGVNNVTNVSDIPAEWK